MNTALRKVILFADQVDTAAQRIFSTIQNGKAGAFPLRKQLVKGGDHNLDRALRRNVFVGLFVHEVSVFIHDPCALNGNSLFLQVYIFPGKAEYLRPAEAVKGQQRARFKPAAAHSVHKNKDLLVGQPGKVFFYALREPDFRRSDVIIPHHGANKAP